MLIVSHIAAGAVVAKVIPGVWIAAPVAFMSHFLLDMIPHAQAPTDPGYVPNKKTYIAVVLDLIFSLALIIYLQPKAATLIVISAAVLPDILDLSRYNKFLYSLFRPYYDFHDKVQNETWKPVGYITQLLLVVGCLLLIGSSR
jgi:hypothetical protein